MAESDEGGHQKYWSCRVRNMSWCCLGWMSPKEYTLVSKLAYRMSYLTLKNGHLACTWVSNQLTYKIQSFRSTKSQMRSGTWPEIVPLMYYPLRFISIVLLVHKTCPSFIALRLNRALHDRRPLSGPRSHLGIPGQTHPRCRDFWVDHQLRKIGSHLP